MSSALSYWFPRLLAFGLPVPRTIILKMPEAVRSAVWSVLDGECCPGATLEFFSEIGRAATAVGYPAFLRTDYTSAKHAWKNTCWLGNEDDIPDNVFSIVEYSETAGIIGLPWDTWVVREMLPTVPFGVCPAYSDMPICKEFRFFVEGGEVMCWHPYWPQRALSEGGASPRLDYDALCEMSDEKAYRSLAAAAGRAVGGAWSVDILETSRGPYVIDMALASESFHWEECGDG